MVFRIKNEISNGIKVMAFGTFDRLHPGHLNFFGQAKKCGDYLVIVVARDINVKKIKGRFPKKNEKQRLAAIKKAGVGDKVLLGQIKNPYAVIKKEKPAVIALGYDQKSFSQGLGAKFPEIKIVRLKSFKPNIYKSSKINKEL